MLAFSEAVGQSIPSLEACRAEFKKHPPQCGMQELRDALARQGFNMSGRAGLRPLAELLIENILKTGQQPAKSADELAGEWTVSWPPPPKSRISVHDEPTNGAHGNGADADASEPEQEHAGTDEPGKADDHEASDANLFLTALDPGATFFTFQTFDDDRERREKALARVIHGTLDLCRNHLRRLNSERAGVFVTINETDGMGRTAKNIVRVRCCSLIWMARRSRLPRGTMAAGGSRRPRWAANSRRTSRSRQKGSRILAFTTWATRAPASARRSTSSWSGTLT